MIMLIGIGLMVAALVLLRTFIPRGGKVASRSEMVDISVAVLVTAGLAIGLMMTVAGVAALWSS